MKLSDETLLLLEQRRLKKVWATAAKHIKLNYAFTVNPDFYPGDPTDTESAASYIHCVSKALFRGLNGELRGLGKRQAEKMAGIDFLGVYEMRNFRGVLYPHAHFAIGLHDGEPERLHSFMMRRWGTVVPHGGSHTPATGKPIHRKLGPRPQYELEPIWDADGWLNYIRKQLRGHTTLDLEVFPASYIRGSVLRTSPPPISGPPSAMAHP